MSKCIVPDIMLMFVNRLGLSLLIPVLPFIVRDYEQTAIIIGPSIGSFSNATRLGYVGTAVVATLIATVTLLVIVFYLDESRPPERRSRPVISTPNHQVIHHESSF